MGLLNRIHLKSDSEIESIKKSSLLVGKTLGEVAKLMRPGVPLFYIDQVAEDYIRANGGLPSCKGYRPYAGMPPFPSTLCLSVNSTVVHGIPNDYVLQEGDIVTADCVACLDGWHGDFAYTFEIGKVSEEKHLLVRRTYEALHHALDFAKVGNTIFDISQAVESYVKPFHYGVVKVLSGHGIGRSMYEKPDVPNFVPRTREERKWYKDELIRPGMVFCIEPMIGMGTGEVLDDEAHWPVVMADRRPAAHFEHQVAINSQGKTEILSTYQYIEEALGINNK